MWLEVSNDVDIKYFIEVKENFVKWILFVVKIVFVVFKIMGIDLWKIYEYVYYECGVYICIYDIEYNEK